jgi:hypothetical protein
VTSGAPLPDAGRLPHLAIPIECTSCPAFLVSAEPSSAAGEFRPYRRFVSWFILTFVTLGTTYMLISVGVTIYRRRHAVPTGSPVGSVASREELESCHEELKDVADGLEKHLENFHHLVAHYDAAEAQRWSEDGSFWLGQWKAAGDRCRFDQHRPGKLGKEWEQLGTVHAELHETEASYTKELTRFGRDQAPRLDRVRESLAAVGKRLAEGRQKSPESGDPTP